MLSTVKDKGARDINMSGEYSRASELDEAVVQEENYKNTVFVLKKEYNFLLETRDNYIEKFNVWLNAYPVAKKNSIIDEHEHDWSVIYKTFHGIFRADVWNEYHKKMCQLKRVSKYGY